MRVPISTYRLQFTADFGFRDAAAMLPYLQELGIDTVYASPIFHARQNPKSLTCQLVRLFGSISKCRLGLTAATPRFIAQALKRQCMEIYNLCPNAIRTIIQRVNLVRHFA